MKKFPVIWSIGTTLQDILKRTAGKCFAVSWLTGIGVSVYLLATKEKRLFKNHPYFSDALEFALRNEMIRNHLQIHDDVLPTSRNIKTFLKNHNISVQKISMTTDSALKWSRSNATLCTSSGSVKICANGFLENPEPVTESPSYYLPVDDSPSDSLLEKPFLVKYRLKAFVKKTFFSTSSERSWTLTNALGTNFVKKKNENFLSNLGRDSTLSDVFNVLFGFATEKLFPENPKTVTVLLHGVLEDNPDYWIQKNDNNSNCRFRHEERDLYVTGIVALSSFLWILLSFNRLWFSNSRRVARNFVMNYIKENGVSMEGEDLLVRKHDFVFNVQGTLTTNYIDAVAHAASRDGESSRIHIIAVRNHANEEYNVLTVKIQNQKK